MPHGSRRCRAVRRPARCACAACRQRSSTRGPLTSAKNLSLNQLGEPAHFDARDRIRPASAAAPAVSAPLVSSRYSAMMVAPGTGGWPSLDQHRRGGGRIELQKFLAALPHPLLDQAWCSSPCSASASRTKRECGQNGCCSSVSMKPSLIGAPRRVAGRRGGNHETGKPNSTFGESLQRVIRAFC